MDKSNPEASRASAAGVGLQVGGAAARGLTEMPMLSMVPTHAWMREDRCTEERSYGVDGDVWRHGT
jgi:hypothetical protein